MFGNKMEYLFARESGDMSVDWIYKRILSKTMVKVYFDPAILWKKWTSGLRSKI